MKNLHSKQTFLIVIAILIALAIVSCSSSGNNRESKNTVRIKNVETGMIGYAGFMNDNSNNYRENDTVWMSNSTKLIVNQTTWKKDSKKELFSLVVIQKKP